MSNKSGYLGIQGLLGILILACASRNTPMDASRIDGQSTRPASASTTTSVGGAMRSDNSVPRLRLCRESLSDFVEHAFGRAMLRVEHGFLDAAQTAELGRRIDTAVGEIEEFLGMKYDATHYQEQRIVVHLFETRCISHVKGGYYQAAAPHVFMSLDEPRTDVPKGPYLHELVHIIAWDWRDLWIREGLAVFVNDELGGYPTYPNYGEPIDAAAAHTLSDSDGERAFAILATVRRVPGAVLYEHKVRRPFYVQAGSFVKYLWSRLGREKFLQIYRSKDPVEAFAQIEGGSLLDAKVAWKESLTPQAPQ